MTNHWRKFTTGKWLDYFLLDGVHQGVISFLVVNVSTILLSLTDTEYPE